MRLAILLVSLLPAISAAAEFRSNAPLTLSGGDSLQRVVLPFEVYRDSRPDLADVRVVNAQGETVPMAWAGEPDVQREAPLMVELPVFPVARRQAGTAIRFPADVTVRASDGTLVAIRTKGSSPKPPPADTMAYLMDASQVQSPIRALVVEWKAGPGTQVVPLRVESSDDLIAWSLAGSASVVKVESADRALKQPRVEFTPRKAKYFRVTWSGPEFALESVRAELERGLRPPTLAVRAVQGTPGAKPGEFVFDLGARLPVEALRIIPADTNAVLSTTVHARDNEASDWRLVLVAPFYRLQREGREEQSSHVDIPRRAARYWMVTNAAGSSGGTPSMEVHWKPAQLIFVARGDAPFSLAFGKPEATAAALPVSTLIPRYERLAEMKLPQATLGEIASGPPPTRWEHLAGEVNTRRVVLWAILLAGVAALGLMAWRLRRQM
ncbi:MAG: DUF3999 domain-containing protein [Usitatibacter sp.]